MTRATSNAFLIAATAALAACTGCSAPELTAHELYDTDLGLRVTELKAGYELPRRIPASELLPSNLLKSSLHTVDAEARLDGLFVRYRFTTSYGTFEALGRPRLEKLLGEARAIHALRAQNTQGYNQGLIESIPASLRTVRAIMKHPRWLLEIWPRTVETGLKELIPITRGWRSSSEDSILQSFLTVSKFKRRIAAQLHIDVYSSNPFLQYELDRLGWEAAAGNWTPTVLTAPIDLGMGAAIASTVLVMSDSLNTYLLEQNPAQLRVTCDEKLSHWGITAEARDRLQENLELNPRHLLELVELLEPLKHANRRSEAVIWLTVSKHRIGASYKLRALALLPRSKDDPIVELEQQDELLAGRRQSGVWILPLPADYLLWTPWLERHVERARHKGASVELIVEGRVSKQARKELESRGVTVTENAEPERPADRTVEGDAPRPYENRTPDDNLGR